MAELQQLLDKTSRTFALAIPLLPDPVRTDVTLAYLLFRIADTLEDAENLEAGERIDAIEELDALLANPSSRTATTFANTWSARNPTNHLHDGELLSHTSLVFEELANRDAEIQRCVVSHVRRTAAGMASFLQQGGTCLSSLAELQRYCYFVAGVVGEMLTEIFVERIEGLAASQELMCHARAFGEGLQLVNILKDSDEDIRRGRSFIPDDVDRSTLFDLARRDLHQADLYVDRLRAVQAPAGYVAFTLLPLQLAWPTLELVERHGPGSKVTRDQVTRILANLPNIVDSVASFPGRNESKMPDFQQRQPCSIPK